MSKYTTEVRYICEHEAGLTDSKGYESVNDIIAKSREKIFSFDYPIFDEAYRPVLETKILKHFYVREIGFETVGLWKLNLDMLMNEIMPYYNKLYESELLKFNPLWDADYYKKNDGTQTGDNTKNANGTVKYDHVLDENRAGKANGKGWEYYSDTPQGNVYDFPGESHNAEGSDAEMTYLTNATKNTSENKSESTHHSNDINTGVSTNTEKGNFKTVDDYLDHVWGKFPGRSYSALLKEFRDTFINIDLMIIKDLSKLFMNLW